MSDPRYIADWRPGARACSRGFLDQTGYQFDSEEASCRGNSGQGPTHIVVHAMGEFIDTGVKVLPAWDFLKREGLSVHSLITPSGVDLRLANTEDVCWHCRADGMNWKALGVELLMPGVHTYTSFVRTIDQEPCWHSKQVDKLVEVVTAWMAEFKIPLENVLQHSEVDSRKVDPGKGFQWVYFLEQCRSR